MALGELVGELDGSEVDGAGVGELVGLTLGEEDGTGVGGNVGMGFGGV